MCTFKSAINAMRGGTLNAMWGGVIQCIKSWFSGLIGPISGTGKVLTDERTKPSK